MKLGGIDNIESMSSIRFHCELSGRQKKKRNATLLLRIRTSDSSQKVKKRFFPSGQFPKNISK